MRLGHSGGITGRVLRLGTVRAKKGIHKQQTVNGVAARSKNDRAEGSASAIRRLPLRFSPNEEPSKKPPVGRVTWLAALLGLSFAFVTVPSTESFACHKYVSKKTGAKGCSAWRADRRKNKSSAKSSKTTKSSRNKSEASGSGGTTAAGSSPPPSGGSSRARLQWNGEWIGGSPSAATQLITVPIGVPYGKAKTGKAAAALRVKVRKSGTLVGVSVLVRMNRPWTSDGKSRYGGYSLGDGGRAIIEIRKLRNRSSSDPADWVPDMSSSGLLAVTEVNGQRSIKAMEDKFLEPRIKQGRSRTIPMWEWKLTKPLRVTAGQDIALVVRHLGNGNVNTRFTINSNGLYGSVPWKTRPYGKNGPVHGDVEAVLYSEDRVKWAPRIGSRGWHPVYALIYSDGEVRGWPFAVGNSGCRDRIGGSRWARMKLEIPNRYPALTLNEVWVAAFRNKAGVGDLIVELRDAGMRVLNSVSIPASSFSVGVPKKSDRPGTRNWTSRAFPNTRIGPGTYYVVLRSNSSSAYWLQGFSDNAVTLARNMVSKVRPRFVDALDVNGKSLQIERSTNGGRSWSRWKGYCEVFPVLFRTR